MSLALRHRARILAAQTVAQPGVAHVEPGGGAVTPSPAPARQPQDPARVAARQMTLRLTHDLRRLKDIQSIQLKIAAKREMLPAYQAWVAGLLAADAPADGDEILPTIMVWTIDVEDFGAAMPLIRHVLKHRIALPARYERSAPALIVEEVAETAIRVQNAGNRFSIDVLEDIDELTAADDIHDEIRAKLHKAIGVEMMAIAEEPGAEAAKMLAALERLRSAEKHNPRVGVKDRIRRAERALAPPARPKTPAKPKAPAPAA